MGEGWGWALLSPGSSPPRCCECSAPLSHQYYEKDGQLFCKKDYWARYGESCHGCSEHITKGLVMVSTPPRSHVSPGLYVRVRPCPHRDLSPIAALVLLFTGSLIPPCLLSLSVCLSVSLSPPPLPVAQQLARQTLKVCLGLPFSEKVKGRRYGS